MSHYESALIMAKSNEWRDALQAILTVIPQIKRIGQTDDRDSILNMVAQDRPALILLDFDSQHDDISGTLSQIKSKCSKAQSIVLVESESEYQMAKAAGADVVLIKGIRAAKLLSILTERVFASSVRS